MPKPHIHLTTTNPYPGTLLNDDQQWHYKENFEGLGTVGQPDHPHAMLVSIEYQ